MTHMSLFSGIGGLDLAAEWAGFETVGQCEWAEYQTKILEKHWPDVPRWRDVRTVTRESFYDKTGRRTVDVISGGFPCQPFSVAGKQEGKRDDRYLWPEMRRVIAELKPRWVVGENVPGILHIAAADVVLDLESLGFNVVVFDFEAAAVGAPHRRERFAFVGHSKYDGLAAEQELRGDGAAGNNRWEKEPEEAEQPERTGRSDDAARIRGCTGEGEQRQTVDNAMRGMCNGSDRRGEPQRFKDGRWWSAEPNVGRVAHGIPDRVDRIRCLGNAVVPQQFYPIFRAIYEWERGACSDKLT